MFRLLNLIFGWDYICWENTCASGVSRVQKDGAGVVFYLTEPVRIQLRRG